MSSVAARATRTTAGARENSGTALSVAGLSHSARRVLLVLLLGVAPATLTLLALAPSGDTHLFDFRVFWDAAREYASGHSPYPELSEETIATKANFVYPVSVAAVFTPLALLPYSLAAALFLLVVVAATPLTLHLLGVRDWRCYGAAFLAAPTLLGIRLGTLSPLLAFGLAVLWRYRDRRAIAVPMLAVLVASKLFLWPLVVWFFVTRRVRAALLATVGAVAVTFVCWAYIGFSDFGSYPELLTLLAAVEQADGFSLVSLGLVLGVPAQLAQLTVLAVGVAVLVVMAARARRVRDGSEWPLFVTALAVAFIASPIIWGHYLMLLLVPLAVARPRLSPLWFAAAWIPPDVLLFGHPPDLWSTVALVCALVAMAAQLGLTLRPRAPGRKSAGGATA